MTSRFLQSYTQGSNTELNELEIGRSLAEKYPEIAAALLGQVGDGNGKASVPGMGLTIRIRDGALKWSLFAEESAWNFFGTIREPGRILDEIEAQLTAGTHDRVAKPVKQAGNSRR